MPRLYEERNPYRHGNTVRLHRAVQRLTLGQLSRYLVNHNAVLDSADPLAELAFQDAKFYMRQRQAYKPGDDQ